jgi:hypothetical protein
MFQLQLVYRDVMWSQGLYFPGQSVPGIFGLLDPEDAGTMILSNVGNCLPVYKA